MIEHTSYLKLDCFCLPLDDLKSCKSFMDGSWPKNQVISAYFLNRNSTLFVLLYEKGGTSGNWIFISTVIQSSNLNWFQSFP